jgi:hypothetical protein
MTKIQEAKEAFQQAVVCFVIGTYVCTPVSQFQSSLIDGGCTLLCNEYVDYYIAFL